jgi:hypothetical protein
MFDFSIFQRFSSIIYRVISISIAYDKGHLKVTCLISTKMFSSREFNHNGSIKLNLHIN